MMAIKTPKKATKVFKLLKCSTCPVGIENRGSVIGGKNSIIE
jgi:hypothetical protein